ncbi:hypothetical protein A3F00_02285 [Candidatus Daviesbacteria bacterium RIFCSPHIGHO2_12_FULL_37_11]|uniref:Ketosynthase family 3 (KS3) domain-containing protein n=1 Tax=Candidatus Daviesbacteria bacterium RIFCSPHIGHO2_12_FULL_37_11 TaxID=1797777 RepID=A0A1F5KDC8_9BACT|nr:MAG: hypothetical protein A3F00_02285 [Candidatus Daviesbacteria bacterium RIFCSPHIGHO2_12_FULL_37_11]
MAIIERESERLAVVGMGALCPIGNDVPTAWRRLLNGEHGIRISEFPEYPHSSVKVAGVVENFEEQDREKIFIEGNIIDPSDFEFYDISTFGGLEVARQAYAPYTVFVEENGRLVPRLNPKIFHPERVGLVVAIEGGGTVRSAINTHERIMKKNAKGEQLGLKAEDEDIIRGLVDTILGAERRTFGLNGEALLVGDACASGIEATIVARRMLLDSEDELDAVLVIGTEWSNHYVPRSQFERITALSSISDPNRTPRPFDKGADGFVIGDMSAAIFMTKADFALRNQLEVLAWHLGAGAYEEAYSMTSPLPNGEGTYNAYQRLLDKRVGGVRIRDMRKKSPFYIEAHGTGTGGDGVEAIGIRRTTDELDGEFAGFSSTKGATGHGTSAAAVLEGVFCVQALREGVMPPNIKCNDPIDEVNGMPLIREATPADIEFVDNLSNGFGGHQRAESYQSVRSTR